MLIYTKISNNVKKLFGNYLGDVPTDSDIELTYLNNEGTELILQDVDTYVDDGSSDGVQKIKRLSDNSSVVVAIGDEIIIGEATITPSTSYLTFSSESPFTLGAVDDGDWQAPSWDGMLEYSLDTKTWTEWDGSTAISSSADNLIYLRGTSNTSFVLYDEQTSECTKSTVFDIQAQDGVECTGNIETLLDYATVQAGGHPVMGVCCFNSLFCGCTSLMIAPALPSMTLTAGCYCDMFDGCTSLTTAPTLPATTLEEDCYTYMFAGCTSLTTAPTLPATTLSKGCYEGMFWECNSLTTAPELSATTLAESCYNTMFQGCTSLTTAPALPATTLADYCYSSMFAHCTSLVIAPALPATTAMVSCYSRMFEGCTSLTTAPELPATTLADNCYEYMFQGCTSLTEAPVLPATTLVYWCYESMFGECTSLTTPPALPATTLAKGCYTYMFYKCSSLMISSTQTENYTYEYRIPSQGTGTDADGALFAMFGLTGGTFTSDPTINTTYYTTNAPVA